MCLSKWFWKVWITQNTNWMFYVCLGSFQNLFYHFECWITRKSFFVFYSLKFRSQKQNWASLFWNLKCWFKFSNFNVLLDNSTFCARRGISQFLAKQLKHIIGEFWKQHKTNKHQFLFGLFGRIQNITGQCWLFGNSKEKWTFWKLRFPFKMLHRKEPIGKGQRQGKSNGKGKEKKHEMKGNRARERKPTT